MQRWKEEFSKHPVHATIKILEDFLATDHPINDPALVSELARLSKVVGLLKGAITELDPDIVPIDIVSALNSNINQSGVLNSLRSFGVSGSASHLVDANAQITSAIGYAYQLGLLRGNRSVRQADNLAATTVLEKFIASIDERLQSISARAQVAFQEIERSRQEIVALQQEAKDATSQFALRLSELNTQTTESLSAFRLEFSEVQSKNKIDFAELISAIKAEMNSKLEDLFTEQTERATISQDAHDRLLSRIQSDAEAKHLEILKFYGLVTHDSISGGHKKIADRELASAQGWRWAAVGSIFLTVVWVFCTLFYLQPQLSPDRLFWLQVAKGLGLTALLVSFAIYASKQSNLHRFNEQKAREFFLKVQAFDPFIASLPDEKRWEMKQTMTERIFREDDRSTEHKSQLDEADFKGLEQVLSFVDRIKSAFGIK